jgi:SAM-dependent methyltransferase
MGSEEEANIRRQQHEAYLMPFLSNYMATKGIERISLLDYGGGEGGIQPRSDRIDTYVHEVGSEADTDDADAERKYDCVQCLHVLEHVGNPLRTCRNAFDRCLPDGLLYIEVPIEFPGLESLTEKSLPICHEHINKLCLQSVRSMLEALDGEVIVVETGEVDFLHLEGLTPVIRGIVRKT